MTGNNPKLDLVNINAHTKFGQILSISSLDIEQKWNSEGNSDICQFRAVTLLQMCYQIMTDRTPENQNPQYSPPPFKAGL